MSKIWTQKPPLGSQINWGDPLSQGLVRAYLFNLNKRVPGSTTTSPADFDLVSKTYLGGRNAHNGFTPLINKNGYELRQVATGGETQVFGLMDSRTNINYQQGVSVACLFKIGSTNGFIERMFGAAFNGGGLVSLSSSPRMVAFYKENYGIGFVVNGASLCVGAMTTTVVSTGTYYCFVGTYQKTGAATYGGIWKTYLNGIRNGTDNNFNLTGSFGGTFASNNSCMLLSNSDKNTSDINIVYAYLWNRTLSPNEAQRLYVNSYSFIIRPSIRAVYLGVTVYEHIGNITFSLTPSHTFNFTRCIVGSVALSLTPNSGAVRTRVYSGDVTLSLMPGSTYSKTHVHLGAISLSLTPNSASVRTFVSTGAIIVTLTPNSDYQLGTGYQCTGNISLSLTPNAIVNRVRAAMGAITIALTPGSIYGKIFKNYDGNITLSLSPTSGVNRSRSILGNISFSLTPNSEAKRVFVGQGGITLVLTPEGTYLLDVAGYSYEGNLVLTLTPNSGAVRVYDCQGNVLLNIIPNSTGELAYLELVRLASGIEKTVSLSSPLDFPDDILASGIEKIVSLSSTIREDA